MGDGACALGAGRSEIAVLLLATTLPAAAAWLYFVALAGSPWMPAVYGASKVVQFSLPAAAALAAAPRRPALPPLAPRALGWGFGSGAAAAAALLGLYALVFRGGSLAAGARPRISDRIEAIGAGSHARYAALALFLSVIHSFLEEYYWRWFVFGRLRAHAGPAAAVAVSSLAFAAHHVIVLHAFMGPERLWTGTAGLSAAVAAAGAAWAALYARAGSITSPWISHALVDAALMAIGYDLRWGW
jgi:membrane protease YdiL (CAAX protease family)